jgi:C4-dicarboxylate transporter DctM subunit
MFAVLLFAVFFAIALAGVPLMYGLLGTTLGMIVVKNLGYPIESIMLSFIGGVEAYVLIAVPLFLFAGELLAKGGAGKRIVNFTQSVLGFLPGGLGVVTVVSCLLFGGVSGSAIADTAAIGSLVIPMMVEKGYPRSFTAALLAVSGTLALLMPLSIPFLVYAFVSGVSMRELSMAGLVPAIVSGLALIIVCMRFGIKSGCDKGGRISSPAEIWIAFKGAAFALLMPVIIVGGIWSGIFTPTEAAAVAAVFGLVISVFVYKDISFKEIPGLLFNAFKTSATVMLVIGATGCLAWLITAEQVAAQIAQWVATVATEPWMFLILVNISLFILGLFIEPLPAMMLSAPLFIPLAMFFKIDMVHFGVIFTGNLAIALYTPPVGGTLFVSAKLAKAGIGEISKRLIPLMAIMLIVIVIVTYIPASTSILRNLIFHR